MKAKGKLIVIDGIDGAGKATQTKLLVEALRRQGRKVETMDFPQYGNNFFGKFIGESLRGDYGDFLGAHARLASIPYACDRLESVPQIRKWLAQGKVVILDRYVSSNQIHQGGKCKNDTERKEFLAWLDRMEHEIFGIPRPDLIVYLSLPVGVSLKLMAERNIVDASGSGKVTRAHLVGKKDQAENDVEHLEASRQSALKIVKGKNNWKKVDCIARGKLLSIDTVHDRVMARVQAVL